MGKSQESELITVPASPSSGISDFFRKAFNTAILNDPRWPWVDYLRGIAIILVVYRHVLIGLERSAYTIPIILVKANMMFFSFRMPLFFILSGLFIGRTLKKRKPSTVIYNKFEGLIYPYLIWAFIQVSLQIALSRFTNANRSFEDYSFILYQPRALDQFWYLPALFNASVVFILLKVKLKLPQWLVMIFGIIFYFAGPYLNQISMISDWMEFFIFFVLGDYISAFFFLEKTQKFLKSRTVMLVIIPVFVVTQIYYLSMQNISAAEFLLIALIGCFSMFVFAFHLQKHRIAPFLRVVGFHSLYIYVVHVLVTAFLRTALAKTLDIDQPVLLLFVEIFFGVVIPIMFYNLCVKDGPLWFLFHLKPNRKGRKEDASKKKLNNLVNR